jgi:hypothetical protein
MNAVEIAALILGPSFVLAAVVISTRGGPMSLVRPARSDRLAHFLMLSGVGTFTVTGIAIALDPQAAAERVPIPPAATIAASEELTPTASKPATADVQTAAVAPIPPVATIAAAEKPTPTASKPAAPDLQTAAVVPIPPRSTISPASVALVPGGALRHRQIRPAAASLTMTPPPPIIDNRPTHRHERHAKTATARHHKARSSGHDTARVKRAKRHKKPGATAEHHTRNKHASR